MKSSWGASPTQMECEAHTHKKEGLKGELIPNGRDAVAVCIACGFSGVLETAFQMSNI